MNLPPSLFQAAIESFKEQPGPQENLRDAPRYRILGSATIIPCSPRVARIPVVVGVCDVSSAGVGIIHRTAMKVAEEFILAIPPTRNQGRRAALFSVIFCHVLPGGTYRIGATFVRELRAASADDGVLDDSASPGILPSGNNNPAPLPASSLARAFRQQATSGLTPEEQAQLAELEKRLAAAMIN